MALSKKKTYSRLEKEVIDVSGREKENVDPFDMLLASPMKQDVQFQPLGFWGKKVRDLESKRKKELKCGLYEGTDSDRHTSWKKSKGRTLQTKSKTSKLSDTRKTHSMSYLNIKSAKQQVLPNQMMTLKSAKEILKSKHSLRKTRNNSLNLSYKNYDSFTCESKPSIDGNISISNGEFSQALCTVNFKNNDDTVNGRKLEFEIYKDNSPAELLENTNKSLIHEQNEGFGNEAVGFNENLGETFVALSDYCHRFKYVTVKRDFNLPKHMNCSQSFSSSPISVFSESHITSPNWLWNEQTEINSVNLGVSENDTIEAEFSGDTSDTLNDSSDYYYYNSVDETLCPEDIDGSQAQSEESVALVESFGVELSDQSDFMYFSNSALMDIKELEQESVDVTIETSSTSDDTFSEGETVIKMSQETTKGAPVADSQVEAINSGSSPNGVSLLTSGISNLSITRLTQKDELTTPGSEKLDNSVNTFSIELKNIVTRGGRFLSAKNEKSGIIDRQHNPSETQDDLEFDQTLELSDITGRTSIDWNKTVALGNPVFESTRVYGAALTDGETPEKESKNCEEMNWIMKENSSVLEHSYALKPGKQWMRSMSVLKQIQNGNLTIGAFESTRITGRKFESFVKDLLKMQNEKSIFFTTAADETISNETSTRRSVKNKFLNNFSSRNSVFECGSPGDYDPEELGDSVLFKTLSRRTILGKSLLNHTLKVVHSEDNSSAFRSALGLDGNRSLIEDGIINSTAENARNFILNECGQEDVLPFEEYFNEKTLPNCKKIGEGVYGEVFMCSDTVIKIIPIEGSQQVNGAPQKTFEEIISEVVISSKLSNLRKGDQNRTEGFSEMKRCWCVRGKYPEFLLKLWNAYDQAGRGSENESPVMFKEDQLYIILELANGGKDLESFVFGSSLQALSVFIQTAFSLAVAEKAFQFEHRDLHWGNLLISKTNDKFITVALDGIEHKIPTKGVKVCIIDFTLSRINHEDCCIFNNLAADPELFTAQGDYQFEIYRMMQKELKNDWSLFNPKTNLFWLHYTIDKMIKMVRYKINNSKVHTKYMKHLKTLEAVILGHKNSSSFILSKSLTDVLIKL